MDQLGHARKVFFKISKWYLSVLCLAYIFKEVMEEIKGFRIYYVQRQRVWTCQLIMCMLKLST